MPSLTICLLGFSGCTGNCPRCHPVPAGQCDTNYWGAESMPLVLSKLKEIGRFILNVTIVKA